MRIKKIRKGDEVQMLSGKDRGKRGKVLMVLPDKGKIVVEGLNLVKRHRRPKKAREKGQRVEVPAAVSVAKAGLVCRNCNRPVRVGFKLEKESKNKKRICRRCQSEIG